MVTSPIEKKKKTKKTNSSHVTHTDLQDVNEFTSLVAGYIKHWAKLESTKLLSTEKRPLILPCRNGFCVGKFRMVFKENHWLIYLNSDVFNTLNYKKSAMVYCLYEHLGKYQQAREVLTLDNVVAKLETDLVYYVRSLKAALAAKNKEKIVILDARIHEAKLQFDAKKSLLKKILNDAKYLKVWDKQP